MPVPALTAFLKDERGLETVEYAVTTALIVTVLVTAFGALATAITNRFTATAAILE